nr:hypothetical protein [Polymorphobacter sp.]
MRNYAGSALMLFVTMAAAVGSYTVNLKVSAERGAVDDLHRQIIADASDMRDLQAELRTRARLPEMQRWNDNVLMMSAPAAGQYLRSPVQLASFGVAPPVAAAEPALRYAVTIPVPATAPAQVVQAAYVRPAPAAPEVARIIRASYPARAAAPRPAAQADAPDMATAIGTSLDAAAAAPRDLLPQGGQ